MKNENVFSENILTYLKSLGTTLGNNGGKIKNYMSNTSYNDEK